MRLFAKVLIILGSFIVVSSDGFSQEQCTAPPTITTTPDGQGGTTTVIVDCDGTVCVQQCSSAGGGIGGNAGRGPISGGFDGKVNFPKCTTRHCSTRERRRKEGEKGHQ